MDLLKLCDLEDPNCLFSTPFGWGKHWHGYNSPKWL